jgi:hypothetical protein
VEKERVGRRSIFAWRGGTITVLRRAFKSAIVTILRRGDRSSPVPVVVVVVPKSSGVPRPAPTYRRARVALWPRTCGRNHRSDKRCAKDETVGRKRCR